MKTTNEIGGYAYENAGQSSAHAYLLPAVRAQLAEFFAADERRKRHVFDLGCGNGSVAATLAAEGYSVCGVDPSVEGIARATTSYPNLELRIGSAYDDLSGQYGCFPAVISLEVVEHVYAPREFARTLYNLVEPDGLALVSTPYHGYWKNLLMAATGKLDNHFTALWDHGHIKFWSFRTLTILLREAGFESVSFTRVGRFSPLAKSMLAIAKKPRVGE